MSIRLHMSLSVTFLVGIAGLSLFGFGCSKRSVEPVDGPSASGSLAPDGQVPAHFALSIEPEGSSSAVYVALPIASSVICEIRNVAGYRVRSLCSGEFPAGVINCNWDYKNDDGQLVKDGYYYAYARAGLWSNSLAFYLNWQN
jgi:flagellar hook assembly protein FlgD